MAAPLGWWAQCGAGGRERGGAAGRHGVEDEGEVAAPAVVDTMNYYPERDGRIGELDANEATSSELVQRHLRGSRVVTAFNNIGFVSLVTCARAAGAEDRSALPVAGDDAGAKGKVVELLDVLGYDAVDIGSLAESWRSEPGEPVPARRVRELVDGAVRGVAGALPRR